jgi:radical SAM-linked protein
VLSRLQPVLPSGLEVLSGKEVEMQDPSLQSQMQAAEYRAVVHSPEPVEAVRVRVAALLDAPTLLRQRHYKGKMRTYDLRPLVQNVIVEPRIDGEYTLTMRLQASPQGAGRPDQVLDALGLSLVPHTVERTNLYFRFDK